MIARFHGDIVVKDLQNGLWELVEPLFYDSADGRSWMIPRGFRTDFGSVPPVVDLIIKPSETVADKPYILHDWLYWCNRQGKPRCTSRKDADDLLYEALIASGVGKVKAWVIWSAVRIAGNRVWSC